jgi:hypothetical protein
VNDIRGAILAAEYISNQSMGRPGVAADDPAEDKITFVRITSKGPDDAQRIFELAENYIPKSKWESFVEALANETNG